MRDETCGVAIKGFAGLKSKIYTLITEEKHESKKAKDINKNVIDDELKYEDYKNVLFNKSYMRNEMNRIQYKDHNIGSYRTHKISLRSQNDKPYILEDGQSRLSHFHKSICRPHKQEFRQIQTIYFNFCFSQKGYFAQIFLRAFKNKLNVFAQQYIIEDYSLKIRENKKQEHKNVTKPLKENKNKDSMSVIEIFLKMRTLKKGIMLTLK